MPRATNMKQMRWDNDLALASEEHAKRCLWRHSDAPELKTRDYIYGENLYLTTAKTLSEEHAVESWYEEVEDYTYGVFGLNDSCVPGKMCGHFTSLAWAETYRVGCAATACKLNADEVLPNKDVILLVCQYYPHGNTVGLIPWASEPSETCETVDPSSSLCVEKTTLCDEKRTCDKDGTKFCELNEDETEYSCKCKDHFLGKHCERNTCDYDENFSLEDKIAYKSGGFPPALRDENNGLVASFNGGRYDAEGIFNFCAANGCAYIIQDVNGRLVYGTNETNLMNYSGWKARRLECAVPTEEPRVEVAETTENVTTTARMSTTKAPTTTKVTTTTPASTTTQVPTTIEQTTTTVETTTPITTESTTTTVTTTLAPTTTQFTTAIPTNFEDEAAKTDSIYYADLYEESGDYDYSDYSSNYDSNVTYADNQDSHHSSSSNPSNQNPSNSHPTTSRITTIKIPLIEPLLILEHFLRSSKKHNTTVFDLRLDEYGCWCSNLAQHGTAIQGYPIDQIDSACRRWSKCRTCMRARQDICPMPFDPSEQYSVKARDFSCLDPRFDDVDSSVSVCVSQCCKCDYNLAKDVMVSLDSYDDGYVNISPSQCRNTNKSDGFTGGGGKGDKSRFFDGREVDESGSLLHARSVEFAPLECDEL